jgi:hypothetical protein
MVGANRLAVRFEPRPVAFVIAIISLLLAGLIVRRCACRRVRASVAGRSKCADPHAEGQQPFGTIHCNLFQKKQISTFHQIP